MIQAQVQHNGLQYLDDLNSSKQTQAQNIVWTGSFKAVTFDPQQIKARLLTLSQPCYIVQYQGQIGVTHEGQPSYVNGQPSGTSERPSLEQVNLLLSVPPILPAQLGSADFRQVHKVRQAYACGAMANGIASEALVKAMGQAQLLSSYGAAGVLPTHLETIIRQLQQALPQGPYAFNLIHSPNEEALERNAVALYLRHGVRTVEASAYLDLTSHIVAYRVAGLSLNAANQIEIKNKVIAKLSRREVARKFLQPAPEKILAALVSQGHITPQQANLARQVPMADDITAEADSGGHTDNRPLVTLLPSILALRDEIQARYHYPQQIRVGAAGGISTPASALAAFMMGADYVVTGSINQACIEAGASEQTKNLLAQADMADVAMAPAADMFEMGVKLQVLKRGTFFAMRAQKLYDLYRAYDSIEAIPAAEREKLEKRIFRRSLDQVWQETYNFFVERDPDQISRAEGNPKRKMALIFRWYLGLSSRWSNIGEVGREGDYQIWCGPGMGAFNHWAAGSYLQEPANRRVVDVAYHIMQGAAYLYRLNHLKLLGLCLAPFYEQYRPMPLNM